MIALEPIRKVQQTPKKIGVSFVIDSLSRAGTEMQLLALIRLLNREEFAPSLVLLDGSDELSKSLEPDCPVLRLNTTKLVSHRAAAAAFELRRFWKEHRPQIVQAYFLDSAYFAVPIAKWLSVPHVLRVRNNLGYWLTRKHRILGRLIRPGVRATLTNSEGGAEQLQQSERRVVVLENGVDLPPLPRGTSANAIGCIANLRPVKNIDGLLRAAAILKSRGIDFVLKIAGDGPERANLEALAVRLGVHAEFLGSVTDVPAFLSKISVSVLPSHSEGMSNALLEAMASAKAVVATDVGANAKVLGDCGIIVPPRDDQVLADALQNLLADPGRAKRFGLAARARVEAHYSRAKMVERFEDYYKSLVAR